MAAAGNGRVRRSIRFAQLNAETAPLVRESAPRKMRFSGTERLEMPSFQNTQDWTSGMGISPSGRFRVIEEQRDRRRAVSREGIRADWARALIWVLAAVLCMTLLVQTASLGAGTLRIQKLEKRITLAEAQQQKLQGDLARRSGDISVCTRAVELNLISSGGAPTIALTAPAANMTLVGPTAAPATQEPEIRAAQGN